MTERATSAASGDGLTRNVGFFGLLFTSEGSIIGSGWLFGALYCATFGGPAAIIAWLIGSVAVILLALVHAELGGMFPVSGGTTRFPFYAFGGLAGASFGWFSWLQAVSTAPIEVEAAITYTSNYWHGLAHKTASGAVILSGTGYAVAVVLMALFVVANLFGIRYLVRANSAITAWKVIIPILTIVVLFFTHFDTSNFTRAGGFAPYGLHGILTAVSVGGAVFSLVGFEQAVQLGGESKNPQRDMPRAVIFSMLIGATIYILLQVVFIGALPQHALAQGWANISFAGIFGPFAGLAKGLGLGWLAYILYADAIIAPTGSGLIYTTTTARITFGMSKNGHVPAAFEKTTKKSNVPVFGLIFTFLMGLLLFLPFPGWQELVGFITSATVLMYAGAPLALGALRHQKPHAERPYRLPWAAVFSPASFVARRPDRLLERVDGGVETDGGRRPRLRADGDLADHPRQSRPSARGLGRGHLAVALPGGDDPHLLPGPVRRGERDHPVLLGHGGGGGVEPRRLLHRHPATSPRGEGRRVHGRGLRLRELTPAQVYPCMMCSIHQAGAAFIRVWRSQ